MCGSSFQGLVWTALPLDRPKFRSFSSLSPPKNSFFSSFSRGSSHRILVVFLKRRDPQMCTWAVGRVKPAAGAAWSRDSNWAAHPQTTVHDENAATIAKQETRHVRFLVLETTTFDLETRCWTIPCANHAVEDATALKQMAISQTNLRASHACVLISCLGANTVGLEVSVLFAESIGLLVQACLPGGRTFLL